MKTFFHLQTLHVSLQRTELLTEAQNILIAYGIKISHDTKCNTPIKLYKVLKGRFTILTCIRKCEVSDSHSRKQV